MSPFYHYKDLSAIDEYYLSPDQNMSHTIDPGYDDFSAMIDPVLTALSPQSFRYQGTKHMADVQQDIAAYNHSFNTYNQPYSLYALSNGPIQYNQTSEWDVPFDDTRAPRYMSPNGNFGGTVSEHSSPGDCTFSPETTRNSLFYCNSPIQVPNSYVLSSMEHGSVQHMTWQPDGMNPYVSPLSYASPQPHCQSQPPVCGAMKDIEFKGPTELHMEDSIHEDNDTIKVKVPSHINIPEVLELSESIPTLSSSGRSFSVQPAPVVEAVSDTEEDEEERDDDNDDDEDDEKEDLLSPENDGDSDYDARPRRPNTVRGAPAGTARHPHPLRRPALSTSRTVLGSGSRVHKTTRIRPRPKSKPHARRPGPPVSRPNPNIKTEKSFPCTFHLFGCDAIFANKNEWKRHVASQHLQLGFFRCDLGTCDPDNESSAGRRQRHNDVRTYNDFNRKDLFTQHCRRMHGPTRHASGKNKASKEDEAEFEDQLEHIRNRCWHIRRKAPARTSCGFCNRVFESNESAEDVGEKAWEERMEHVGRHYERGNVNVQDEGVDEDLIEWGIQNGVFQRIDGKAWLVGYTYPRPEDAVNPGTGVRKTTRRRRMRTTVAPELEKDEVAELSDEDADAEDE